MEWRRRQGASVFVRQPKVATRKAQVYFIQWEKVYTLHAKILPSGKV